MTIIPRSTRPRVEKHHEAWRCVWNGHTAYYGSWRNCLTHANGIATRPARDRWRADALRIAISLGRMENRR